jgi:hypothetical protein
MAVVRPLLSVLLIALALFAAIGIIASFEPGPSFTVWASRTVYILVFLGCIAGLYRLWFRTRDAGGAVRNVGPRHT